LNQLSKSLPRLGRLYPVLDLHSFPNPEALFRAAEELAAAGVTLLQYRNKLDDSRSVLEQSRELTQRLSDGAGNRPLRLIMNDRADLCLAAGWDGVHVGQTDLSPGSARLILGSSRWLGVSTHNPEQVEEADQSPADYIAIGPVFSTVSKANPDPVIGLAGLRAARGLTHKPLVAIGGITRQNCRAVIDAGADSVAVISDLIRQPGKSAEEFLCILE
jgi:thiamine-phosphate pyrophosphorylase